MSCHPVRETALLGAYRFGGLTPSLLRAPPSLPVPARLTLGEGWAHDDLSIFFAGAHDHKASSVLSLT